LSENTSQLLVEEKLVERALRKSPTLPIYLKPKSPV
jgi:hypothetical protein